MHQIDAHPTDTSRTCVSEPCFATKPSPAGRQTPLAALFRASGMSVGNKEKGGLESACEVNASHENGESKMVCRTSRPFILPRLTRGVSSGDEHVQHNDSGGNCQGCSGGGQFSLDFCSVYGSMQHTFVGMASSPVTDQPCTPAVGEPPPPPPEPPARRLQVEYA